MTKIGALVAIFACATATETQAQTQGSSLMADFQSTTTQIHSAQRRISRSNSSLGKLRGALRILGGHNKQISTQITKSRVALKTVSLKLAAARKLHHERSKQLMIQQARLIKSKNHLMAERRFSAVQRAKLRKTNDAIKKATKYVKKQIKKANKKANPSIAKAKRALKKQAKKTRRIMRHARGHKHHGKHVKAVRKNKHKVSKAKRALKHAIKKAKAHPSGHHKRAVKKAKRVLKKAQHKLVKAKHALKKHAKKHAHAHKKAHKKKAAKKHHKAKKLAQIDTDSLVDSI